MISYRSFLAVLACSFALFFASTSDLWAGPVNASKSASSSQTARLAPTDARLTTLEKQLFDLVNEARKKEGLPLLAFDSALSEVARAHSAEMRDKNYFAHESPTAALRRPLDRYRIGIGGTPRLIAENIFRSWGYRRGISQSGATQAHNSLMNSPGHHANILRSGPTRIGIGFVANSNGDLWVTQLFARP